MKTKKIYIFLLIGLLALTAVFESATTVAATRSPQKGPFFYISPGGNITFKRKEFGEFTNHKYKGQCYTNWLAIDVPIKNKFTLACKSDITFFTKFLFGKKMKSQKVAKLKYKIPNLGHNQYKIDWMTYNGLLKEIWVNFSSKESGFVLIYKLDKNFNIKKIEFLTD